MEGEEKNKNRKKAKMVEEKRDNRGGDKSKKSWDEVGKKKEEKHGICLVLWFSSHEGVALKVSGLLDH